MSQSPDIPLAARNPTTRAYVGRTPVGRNRAVGIAAGLAALGMVGAAFAAVPLYRVFCQVTGYGGATNVAAMAPSQIIQDRIITVNFDANVARGMAWDFRPAQRRVSVAAGEDALAFYVATNPSDRTITGSATFNVSPAKAGKYFSKIQCFCFTEQVLTPGQTVDMGISFFVDPEIVHDRDLDDVTEITLSYTFFEVTKENAELGPVGWIFPDLGGLNTSISGQQAVEEIVR